MAMSKTNTFMSDGSVNEDAESPDIERGARPAVAWNQRGRSGNHISAGTRHLAAASVSVSAAGAHNSPCGPGWRTVSACNIQDSTRRARAIASVFGEERLDAECNCQPRHREVFDRDSSTRQTWLSDPRSLLKSVWNLLSIVCSPSSYSRFMSYWFRIESVR
jgi:hypothetical protein